MTVILVKVRPQAACSTLVQQSDGSYVAKLKAVPVDGKANAELVHLVARQFKVPRSAVSIKTGAGSRLKRVLIDDGG
jgi:uncharacterized protein